MKKLKSAEEYLDNDDLFCYPEVEDIIRKVQIDTIRTTAENCAEGAVVKTITFVSGRLQTSTEHVDKQSILNVADKMIEEL